MNTDRRTFLGGMVALITSPLLPAPASAAALSFVESSQPRLWLPFSPFEFSNWPYVVYQSIQPDGSYKTDKEVRWFRVKEECKPLLKKASCEQIANWLNPAIGMVVMSYELDWFSNYGNVVYVAEPTNR